MLRIGLTGGIGCGKSTVAQLFARRGIPVIDADEIAHQLTAPGQEAVREIAEALGVDLIQDGKLDRRLLAERVFQDRDKRRRLEAILHPRIRVSMQQHLERVTAPYCLLVIPLLIETNQRDLVDRILVVDIDEQLQIDRVRHRDQRNPKEIRAILSAQVSRSHRLTQADDVIMNNGTLDDLDRAVEQLHRKYLAMAATRPASG